MASKMQNWIEYQRRHLTADAFDAWVAGNTKVQSFLDRAGKIPAAVRALDDLQRDFLKKVMGPGLKKGSEYLAQKEKSAEAGSSKTGVLGQSIGSSTPEFWPATFCGYIASGPRRGFARVVAPVASKSGEVKYKRKSKKASEHPDSSHLQVPTLYAVFLRGGRKAVTAGQKGSGAKALVSFMGQFFGHSVKEAAPRDFMAPAVAATDNASQIATDEMQTQFEKLLPDKGNSP